MEVDTAETDYLLGLLGEGHVEYDSERVEGRDPTLEQMVEVALQVRETFSLLFVTFFSTHSLFPSPDSDKSRGRIFPDGGGGAYRPRSP